MNSGPQQSRRCFIESAMYVAAASAVTGSCVENLSASESSPIERAPIADDANGDRIAASTASRYRPYQSGCSNSSETSTWVQIDLAASEFIDAVVIYPSHEVQSPGDGFPFRFRIECADDPELVGAQLIAERSAVDYPDPLDRVLQFSARRLKGRYVRLTALKLRKKKQVSLPAELPFASESVFFLSLAKISVLSNGRDIAVSRRVSVDPVLGVEEEAQQLTRVERPQGEGVTTNNSSNVTSSRAWRLMEYQVSAPMQRVRLNGGLFETAMENNIAYLLESFSDDELLRQFRMRAGKSVSEPKRKPHPFWDDDLAGSSAGRFLMGAGNTLRWIEHSELRHRMDAIVGGIAQCRQRNGYIMAYPENTIFVSERGAYTRSWVTHGLIDAGYAGSREAFELLRSYYDWYNRVHYLPQLLRRCNQGGQGMVANTRLYFTPVGKPADIQVIQRYFQENYWISSLVKRRTDAFWQYPYDRPHAYLITNLEAYLDLYRATGDVKYLEAVDGAWDLLHENWQNNGGIISIIETERCEPKSNKLYALLGETCGNAFWILLNHRLHLLRPTEEKYVAEIEKSIYNVILANQEGSHGIRIHTHLVGHKGPATRENTCCEGQGTRLIASLPEYIYSIAPDGLYINLYEPSMIEWKNSNDVMRIEIRTSFPHSGKVELGVGTQAPQRAKLHIRVPSWATRDFSLLVNGTKAAVGVPGTYVVLDRRWSDGDVVSFELPMALRLSKYTGVDQIVGHERFSLEYGPLLMAALGAEDFEIVFFPSTDRPEELIGKFLPSKERGTHFKLSGLFPPWESVDLIPYYEVAKQSFTCFPTMRSRNTLFAS